jgi:hypothetical protein
MSRTLAITLAALALAAATSPVRAEGPIVSDQAAPSSLSRSDVMAEYRQFKKGSNPWSSSYDPFKGFKAERQRGDVAGEYRASQGEVRALTGEDSGSDFLARKAARPGAYTAS